MVSVEKEGEGARKRQHFLFLGAAHGTEIDSTVAISISLQERGLYIHNVRVFIRRV